MHYYQVIRLRDTSHSTAIALIDYVRGTLQQSLKDEGLEIFGTFQGLFGLSSNEVYLVLSSPKTIGDISSLIKKENIQQLESINLVPTVRPTDHRPRDREGIYVFRWFDVLNKDVETIAELSAKAWTSFETDFDTEVQALFAEVDFADNASAQAKMLLITWYKDLSVWQTSRQPSAEARDNFIKRQALTLKAHPVATRLIPGA